METLVKTSQNLSYHLTLTAIFNYTCKLVKQVIFCFKLYNYSKRSNPWRKNSHHLQQTRPQHQRIIMVQIKYDIEIPWKEEYHILSPPTKEQNLEKTGPFTCTQMHRDYFQAYCDGLNGVLPKIHMLKS